jgi:hypothetical protein
VTRKSRQWFSKSTVLAVPPGIMIKIATRDDDVTRETGLEIEKCIA